MGALKYTDNREGWAFLAIFLGSLGYNYLIEEIATTSFAIIWLAFAVGCAHLDLYRLRSAIKLLDEENRVLKNRSEWLLRNATDNDRPLADIYPAPVPTEEYTSPFWGD
jgi:hypothetical protein